jgi:hypothetical protein
VPVARNVPLDAVTPLVKVPDAAFTPVVAVIVPAVRPYTIFSPPTPRTVDDPTVIPLVNVPDAAFTPVVAVIVPAVRPYVIVSPPKPRTVEEPTVIPPLNVPDAATTPYGRTKFPFVANTATEEEFTPNSDVLLPFPLNAAVVTTPVETPPEPATITPVRPAPFP